MRKILGGNMKITSINNQNAFRGLWGESIIINERKQAGKNLVFANYETKIYYPFGDESIEDVNTVMRKNTTYKRVVENGLDTLSISQTGVDVSVKQRLLFSAKQWINYINNKLSLSNVERQLIEQNLRRLKLEKYIRV